jgi:hypothetical protein
MVLPACSPIEPLAPSTPSQRGAVQVTLRSRAATVICSRCKASASTQPPSAAEGVPERSLSQITRSQVGPQGAAAGHCEQHDQTQSAQQTYEAVPNRDREESDLNPRPRSHAVRLAYQRKPKH